MTTESNVAADAGAKPLSGLKVLDFCWVAVGPMITKYLAEYGATVIRVESSKRPDTLRSGAPLKDDIPGINRKRLLCQLQRQQVRSRNRHAPPQGQAPDTEAGDVGRPAHGEFHPGHPGKLGDGFQRPEEAQPPSW